MLKHIGVCWLFLALILVPFVNAETLAEQAATGSVTTIDTANKYLTAEAKKEIQSQMNVVQDALIKNNDDNFRELDARMFELMEEVRTKVIVGGIGAVFVAQAIGMFLLMSSMKRNSYEAFVEKLAKEHGLIPENQAELGEKERAMLEQLQQMEYMQQEPQPTMAQQYGVSRTGEMSQMNQWQTQPIYDGAWQSPQEYEPYIERYASVDDQHQYTGEVRIPNPQHEHNLEKGIDQFLNTVEREQQQDQQYEYAQEPQQEWQYPPPQQYPQQYDQNQQY